MHRLLFSATFVLLFANLSMVTVQLAHAEEIDLGAGLRPKPNSEIVPANKFKKPPPWKIAVSLPGLGNTWLLQLIEESKYAASLHKNIIEYQIFDAGWKPAKQVADLEDMLVQKPDLIIVAPVTPTSAKASIDKIAAQGIPIIISGISAGTNKYTVNLLTGGKPFGRVGGEFLVNELNGKGSVWMIRGIAGVAEDEDRYQGAIEMFKGTNIKISAEAFGDWGYAKGKRVCETLVLSAKPVDGIWFSGAEMTKGCIEVFQEFGKPLVPMTGEGNNGFIRMWIASQVKSIAPVFPATVGAAQIKVAVALLQGKELYKDYISTPDPITEQNKFDFYFPNLNDNFWIPTGLPEQKVMELYGK